MRVSLRQPPITVLKECDSLCVLGAIFDSKMTFVKNLCSVSSAASQRLDFMGKSLRVYNDRLLLERFFQIFVLSVLEYCSAV